MKITLSSDNISLHRISDDCAGDFKPTKELLTDWQATSVMMAAKLIVKEYQLKEINCFYWAEGCYCWESETYKGCVFMTDNNILVYKSSYSFDVAVYRVDLVNWFKDWF